MLLIASAKVDPSGRVSPAPYLEAEDSAAVVDQDVGSEASVVLAQDPPPPQKAHKPGRLLKNRLPVHLSSTVAIRNRLTPIQERHTRIKASRAQAKLEGRNGPALPPGQCITVSLAGRILSPQHLKAGYFIMPWATEEATSLLQGAAWVPPTFCPFWMKSPGESDPLSARPASKGVKFQVPEARPKLAVGTNSLQVAGEALCDILADVLNDADVFEAIDKLEEEGIPVLAEIHPSLAPIFQMRHLEASRGAANADILTLESGHGSVAADMDIGWYTNGEERMEGKAESISVPPPVPQTVGADSHSQEECEADTAGQPPPAAQFSAPHLPSVDGHHLETLHEEEDDTHTDLEHSHSGSQAPSSPQPVAPDGSVGEGSTSSPSQPTMDVPDTPHHTTVSHHAIPPEDTPRNSNDTDTAVKADRSGGHAQKDANAGQSEQDGVGDGEAGAVAEGHGSVAGRSVQGSGSGPGEEGVWVNNGQETERSHWSANERGEDFAGDVSVYSAASGSNRPPGESGYISAGDGDGALSAHGAATRSMTYETRSLAGEKSQSTTGSSVMEDFDITGACLKGDIGLAQLKKIVSKRPTLMQTLKQPGYLSFAEFVMDKALLGLMQESVVGDWDLRS